jgi:acetyl/propionyl-CoA carboxylase alpha subunit/acetyl-CoA carboxylase carboxyltransferase component
MIRKLLIANRGEIALRIVRAASDLGLASVAVHAADDAQSPHVRAADEAAALDGIGPPAYLDIARLIDIARERGCDAVHPGYGFLAERADFAAACASAGLVFVGPTVEQLALFGDKASARRLAADCGVPLMPGSAQAVSLAEAQAFFAAQHGAGVMIKAIGGGGGRGMRAVLHDAELPEAYARCVSEARSAFGVDSVYVERLMRHARHVEVQVIGDGHEAMSLGERECSLQRRFQKLVEIAPSPSLTQALRERITHCALAMARATRYRSLGTFEFLVDEASPELPFVFIEANPRLQVEHTVTEQVTGLDLVQLQIGVAAGQRLGELGLDPASPPQPQGHAIQWRINAETLDAQGQARPSAGRLTRLQWPAGPGIRIDTHAEAGTAPSPHYDTLLAKLIVHAPGPRFADALRRARRALAECVVDGVATNLGLLRAIAARPEFERQALHTGFVEAQLPALLDAARVLAPIVASPAAHDDGPDGCIAVGAAMTGRLVQVDVAAGDVVQAGAQVAVLEAMKMEHLLLAETAGRVLAVRAQAGDYVAQGQPVVLLERIDAEAAAASAHAGHDPAAIRRDLQRVIDRHALTLDDARPEAIARRHALGLRSARENIADLCDAGSFAEYGALAVAAQRSRRSADDLMRNTPADGMVTGVGSINGADFGPERARAVVMAYDATVLAGTQGMRNHQKTDRMLGLALQNKLPVVLFAEGGGGRPGDTDMPIVAGLHVTTFASFAKLSGQVPLIGIVAGRCFAGNAALVGCCDTIIATRDSNIGMGGPAMIEGGGLGVFKPEQVGPADVQSANGVIDVLVDDEAQAVAAAKQCLSYFQGPLARWSCEEQSLLRDAVPENRLRVYDVRRVLRTLADSGSLLELRAGFGPGIVTALARIEGRAIGVLANNPAHLGGAIDATAADKAARFMQLCNAHGLPMLSLVDTPGFMVGPDIETQAQVRHVSRLFVVAGALRVPYFSVVLRKGYGLGAMGMTAGGFHSPDFIVAWPTGEFGAMGLEGAVRLGYRKELEAVPAGAEREARYRELVARQYEAGGALNMAATLEIDAVIDPAQTRAWVVRGLASTRVREAGGRFIDTW